MSFFFYLSHISKQSITTSFWIGFDERSQLSRILLTITLGKVMLLQTFWIFNKNNFYSSFLKKIIGLSKAGICWTQAKPPPRKMASSKAAGQHWMRLELFLLIHSTPHVPPAFSMAVASDCFIVLNSSSLYSLTVTFLDCDFQFVTDHLFLSRAETHLWPQWLLLFWSWTSSRFRVNSSSLNTCKSI